MDYQLILEELLNKTDLKEQVSILKKIDNPLLLHYFIENYNWDNGLDIPNIIIDHKECDFGTGLYLFYHADGLRLLQNPDEVVTSPLKQWREFLEKLYYKLIIKDFIKKEISYDPALTKIQILRIKKANPDLPEHILNKSPGKELEVPKI
jgi:Domain of unknown function (DUF4274)